MPSKEQCVLFRRTEEEVAAVRQVFGLTENSIREGVDSLMEWFQKQPHLAHIDISPPILEMMILVGKGSIERAKEKIDNFYKWRFLLPEMVQNRQPLLCSSNKLFEMYNFLPLPKLHENRRVFIIQFKKELSKFDLSEFFKVFFLLLDYRMANDYMAGDIWIVDFLHVSWSQLLSQNPLIMKRMAQFFTKCLNWRIHGVHFINISYGTHIVQFCVDFFRQYITSIIMDRILVHKNVQGLYDHLPKEFLPEDYGGKELSTDKLAELTENEYKSPKIKQYLLECSKMVSNESLRPRDENSEEHLAGSFRKLEVD